YKAVYKKNKAYPPPLLIEKAYENSTNKTLPNGFFDKIGKDSEHFKFLVKNGFDIVSINFDKTKHFIMYYVKKVLNQDIERTFSVSNEAAINFFKETLSGGERSAIEIRHYKENMISDQLTITLNKRNTRNEHRLFFSNKPVVKEDDIILFSHDNGFAMEIINKKSDKYDLINKVLKNKNHLVTDTLSEFKKTHSIQMKHTLNQILYGPPGTGKTYSTITKALVILGLLDEKETYTDNEYSNAQEVFKKELGKRIEFVTMHQSYSYEDFVQGLKPEKSEDGQGIVFNYKDGVFKSICDSADENRILVKKEIKDEIETDRLFPSFMLSIDENTVYSLLSKYVFDNNNVPQYRAIEYFNDKLGKKYCKAWRDKFDYVLEDESPRVGYQPDKFREGELDAFHRYAEEFKQLTKEEQVKKLKNEWFKVELHIETDIKQVNNYVIILDEINRCNVSKVFGELITLIEDDKRDKFETTLPSGERFTVPKNLHIIGTMNTADKSISMVDIALRRRFEFQAMYPNSGLVRDEEKRKFMESVNAIIREKKSIDFEIGHSDFMKTLSFKDTLNRKVIPLLVEYFRNDMSVVKDIVAECIDSRSSVQVSEQWFESTGLVRMEEKSN
ncbi:MAG: AAA family ATPase, partial [Crocinitomicaceae bacterium]|nr:AAA family ATPase [Crocinitomicaceae bacterium]